ncbi:hypothetical protein [Thioalkalivibrio sp. ALE12]|nr:hypothetical protein [Thioalkalivibrio sp. ALE12]
MKNPTIFSQELSAAALHLHRFFEAFKGGSPEPDDSPGFMATEGLDRPGEFLQCLLDVIRVNFDPHAPGTLFLNSNIELISEGVRPDGFSLAYGSLVSGPDEALESFWESDVLTYLGACGCDLPEAHALYVIITTGPERFQIGLADAASTALDGTPGHDQRQASKGGIESFGFCMDPALGDRLRVSVWAFSARDPG